MNLKLFTEYKKNTELCIVQACCFCIFLFLQLETIVKHNI